MNACDTYVCLVSQQVDANLLPLLAFPKFPAKVVMLVTDDMKRKADEFEEALASRTRIERLELNNPYDALAAANLLAQLPRNGSIEVNITGGTKPMSIGCMMFCANQHIPYFYLTLKGEIQRFPLMLPTENGVKPAAPAVSEPLNLHLNQKTFALYIKAHGLTVEKTGGDDGGISAEDEQDFFKNAILRKSSDGIAQLNALASTANGTTPSVEYKAGDCNPALEALFDKTTEYGWTRFENGRLYFRNERVRAYLNGLWFENYVKRCVSEALPGVDVYRSMTVQRSNYKNELDIVFFYKNRMHVMEVKTCRFENDDKAARHQDYAHKLDSVTQLVGGANAKAAFISLMPIHDSHLLGRLKDIGCTIMQDNSVRTASQFKGYIKKWANQ